MSAIGPAGFRSHPFSEPVRRDPLPRLASWGAIGAGYLQRFQVHFVPPEGYVAKDRHYVLSIRRAQMGPGARVLRLPSDRCLYQELWHERSLLQWLARDPNYEFVSVGDLFWVVTARGRLAPPRFAFDYACRAPS